MKLRNHNLVVKKNIKISKKDKDVQIAIKQYDPCLFSNGLILLPECSYLHNIKCIQVNENITVVNS